LTLVTDGTDVTVNSPVGDLLNDLIPVDKLVFVHHLSALGPLKEPDYITSIGGIDL